MSTTSLVRNGLGTAREHLHAIRVLVDAQELFPSATSTLGRSALMAASLVVWLLAPAQEDERLRRSLSLVVYDYENYLKFGSHALKLRGVLQLDPTADEHMAFLNNRRAQVAEL